MPIDQAKGVPLDPAAERERLQVLHALDLRGQTPVPVLDALVRAASRETGCPIALVNLIDEQDARHVARCGLDASQSPREQTFCHSAMQQPGFFEVEDLAADPRFAAHALVVATPGLRHYAAVPLWVGGQVLGTLCVLDHQPGRLAAPQRATLEDLASAAANWLTLLHQHRLLEAQSQRLMDLVRAGSDWVWELDEAGQVVWIDGELQALTGLAPQALIGQPFEAEPLVELGGTVPTGCRTLHDVLARREAFSRVVSRMATPQGELLISRSAQPVHDLQGRFRGYRGASRDITHAVEHENARRRRASDEAARQQRNSFLSRVSHELRTPLNAILGFTQLIAMDGQEALPPRQAERLAGVSQAGQQLLELVDDVLEIVQLQQGGRPMLREVVPLEPLVRQALADQASASAARQLAVQAEVPADLAVVADREALAQVLRHLVSNGIKYNRPGGRLTLRAQHRGERVWLAVEDSGEGLGAAELQQLFQPFQRARGEHQRVPGSGLGLVLVRELMLAMHGQVQARSRLGEGSVFEIELSAAPQANAANTPATQTPPEAAPRRVLYIEDEPLNVLLMQEVFKARPAWELRVARDGEEGLATAREWVPDLALIDMNLPDCSGLDVLAALRAAPGTRQLRCIALSADAMCEQVEAARQAGFDDYWTKPIDLRHLLDAVGQAIALGPRP